MSSATGNKWAKDDSRFGTQLMKKAGWDVGKGLGKNEDGTAEHVKVRRKDDTLGIGYDGNVSAQQVWSQQAVGFADVLKKINAQTPPPQCSDDSDEDGVSPEIIGEKKTPSAGKHAVAFTKRRALKTEGLRSAEGKSEVLGAASSSRKRERDSVDVVDDGESTLKSPLLQRLMQRSVKHEPIASMNDAGVTITKPTHKPPKPQDTPFLLKE